MDLNDQQTAVAYKTLRVALRNAILRVSGTRVGDVSIVYRFIEDGMGVGDATDGLEALLKDIVSSKAGPRN